jgi:phosphatidylglycerophosphate synthase
VDKVPAEHQFIDLSDYARPAARWLVRRLLPTRITPNTLTLAFTVVGLAAAALLAVNRWLPLAALLLLVKSALDAADGALARARGRPSRTGRFLDSVCDFVVNAALFAGLALGAYARGAGAPIFGLAAAALVSALLQVSVFNHYYVRYRSQTGGDQTSRVSEAEASAYPWDDPQHVRFLLALYRFIYGWQDALVAHFDQVLTGGAARPVSSQFMTRVSVLGLGTQLLMIALCAVIGRPVWALWAFATLFNVYAAGLMMSRRAGDILH